ncbi:hypothetical protein BDN71DRAFT_268557 [Pleurotus eryngii]|uniref:Uncharacterized protein n=1 Tax=Pleurotus eryngii TaxID=5323 RepID=A0A9P6DIA2_PLEER|nr:hypothetical protein BDN71DRAFT_268557 [Pleurotus eryngii]
MLPYGEAFRSHRKFVHSSMTKGAVVTYQTTQTAHTRLFALNLLENRNQHEMLINRRGIVHLWSARRRRSRRIHEAHGRPQ